MTQPETKSTAAEIEARVDRLLKRSTGKKIAIVAGHVGLLSIIHIPLYMVLKKGIRGFGLSDFEDLGSSPPSGKADPNITIHRITPEPKDKLKDVGDYVDFEMVSPNSNDNNAKKNTPPKESFWKDPHKAALAYTAISTLVFSLFSVGSSFFRHNRAVQAIKNHYTTLAHKHPEAPLPDAEDILRDYASVMKHGTKVLEYGNVGASRSR